MDKPLVFRDVLLYSVSMAGRKFIKTKHAGVYYRESTAKVSTGKPDRCFVVWYTDATGKGRWHTVGWASKGYTEKYALAARQELLTEVARGNDPGRQRGYTVGQAVDLYTLWAEAEGKSIEREKARYALHMRNRFHSLPIASLNTTLLATIKAELLKKISPASVTHCFSFVRRAIYHAISENAYTGPNPVATKRKGKWKMPAVDNAAFRWFLPEEAQKLLEELKVHQSPVHDMSLLSLKTGMRSAEIFTVRGQDIDKAGGLIHFRAKGGKRQFVHAPQDVIEMLLSYGRKPGEYIFQAESPTTFPGRAVKGKKGDRITRGVSATFARAVDKLGFNEGVTDRRMRVWFHTWRHTFASWLAQSGKVTLLELKELMRHKSISMTLRYAHLIPGHQKKSLAIIGETLTKACPPHAT